MRIKNKISYTNKLSFCKFAKISTQYRSLIITNFMTFMYEGMHVVKIFCQMTYLQKNTKLKHDLCNFFSKVCLFISMDVIQHISVHSLCIY